MLEDEEEDILRRRRAAKADLRALKTQIESSGEVVAGGDEDDVAVATRGPRKNSRTLKALCAELSQQRMGVWAALDEVRSPPVAIRAAATALPTHLSLCATLRPLDAVEGEGEGGRAAHRGIPCHSALLCRHAERSLALCPRRPPLCMPRVCAMRPQPSAGGVPPAPPRAAVAGGAAARRNRCGAARHRPPGTSRPACLTR